MSSRDRQPLNIPGADDLNDFAPRPKPAERVSGTTSGKQPAHKTAPEPYPSREAAQDGQLGIKGPKPVLERFKALCKNERWPMHAMLEILMDSYEEKTKG